MKIRQKKKGMTDTKENGLISQKNMNVQRINIYNTKDGDKRRIPSVMYKRIPPIRYDREREMQRYDKRKKKLHGLQLLFYA